MDNEVLAGSADETASQEVEVGEEKSSEPSIEDVVGRVVAEKVAELEQRIANFQAKQLRYLEKLANPKDENVGFEASAPQVGNVAEREYARLKGELRLERFHRATKGEYDNEVGERLLRVVAPEVVGKFTPEELDSEEGERELFRALDKAMQEFPAWVAYKEAQKAEQPKEVTPQATEKQEPTSKKRLEFYPTKVGESRRFKIPF